jgi:hypothetical protein
MWRVLREKKQLSQGDIEKRTGLPRCCISPSCQFERILDVGEQVAPIL